MITSIYNYITGIKINFYSSIAGIYSFLLLLDIINRNWDDVWWCVSLIGLASTAYSDTKEK